MKYFTSGWIAKFIDAWNVYRDKTVLANLGTIYFEFAEHPSSRFGINWDETGTAKLVQNKNLERPCFIANEQNWEAFFDGKFSAAIGLLRGKIKLHGKMSQIIKYSAKFNHIPVVGRTIID